MSLDTDAIKQELAALNSQRHEVQLLEIDIVMGHRALGPLDGPPNPLDRQPRRPFLARGPLEPEPAFERFEAPRQPAPRHRVLSAVVVAGEARTAHEAGPADPAGPAERGGSGKRPAEGELLDDNPAVKKRNRRLFGALLGTLQKFKEDEQREAGSDVAQRRAQLLARAEQKKEEEARRLREEARQEMQSRRMDEINRKREINMLSDIKRLELLYAEKLARHDRLSTFLKTKAGPSVYWCPKQHSHITLRLHEQQRQELQQWKAGQLDLLQQEKAEIRARFEKAVHRGEEAGGEEAGGAQAQEEEEGGMEEGGHDEVEEGHAGEAVQNGRAGREEGGGEPMEGAEQHAQPAAGQPAADDRYEAEPESPHDHEGEHLGQVEGEQRHDVSGKPDEERRTAAAAAGDVETAGANSGEADGEEAGEEQEEPQPPDSQQDPGSGMAEH
ncbi:hypothetical protein N2152v2_001896 [Parachlorella kessleri]